MVATTIYDTETGEEEQLAQAQEELDNGGAAQLLSDIAFAADVASSDVATEVASSLAQPPAPPPSLPPLPPPPSPPPSVPPRGFATQSSYAMISSQPRSTCVAEYETAQVRLCPRLLST